MAADVESISIRVATRADVEGVLDVQHRSPGRSASPEFRDYTARAIDDTSLLFLVAETAIQTVGWAMTKHFAEAEHDAPAGHYLMGLTVASDYRRKGVATQLVQARLDWIRRRDDRAYYFTNVCNAASIALHKGLGFQEIARAPQFRGVPFDGGTGILFSLSLNRTTTAR